MRGPNYELDGRRISVKYLRDDIQKISLKILLRAVIMLILEYSPILPTYPGVTATQRIMLVLFVIAICRMDKVYFLTVIDIIWLPDLCRCIQQCNILYADLTAAIDNSKELPEADVFAFDLRFDAIKIRSRIDKLTHCH
jgi:hypothetical protein